MKLKHIYFIFRQGCYLLKKKYNDFLFKKKLMLEKNIFIGPNVTIDTEYPWLISIGKNCYLTKGVVILTHDASIKLHTGYSKLGKVTIGENTFVGMNSIILPNVSIGDNCIIGAGSVVTHNIPNYCVATGNPAKVISSTLEVVNKHKQKMSLSPKYEAGWTIRTGITTKKKDIMNEELKESIGYII